MNDGVRDFMRIGKSCKAQQKNKQIRTNQSKRRTTICKHCCSMASIHPPILLPVLRTVSPVPLRILLLRQQPHSRPWPPCHCFRCHRSLAAAAAATRDSAWSLLWEWHFGVVGTTVGVAPGMRFLRLPARRRRRMERQRLPPWLRHCCAHLEFETKKTKSVLVAAAVVWW